MSDSLQLHGLQHTRCPCLSLSPGFCPSSFPLNWWCSPNISPFAFNLSQHQGLLPWVGASHQSIGQNIGTSASTSVLPVNIQYWFPLGLISFISLLSKGLSRLFSSETVQKHQSLTLSLLYGPTLTSVDNYWKTIALTIWTFATKVMFMLFNMLSRFVIAFLPKPKHLLISWLQSPSAVIFGA